MTVTLNALTEKRRYLRIQPADEALQPETIERSIPKLQRTVRGSDHYPTYEFLITAVGESDDDDTRSLAFFVGVDDTSDNALDATRRALRGCLPNTYDVVEATCSFADLLELPLQDAPISGSDSDPESTDSPTIVPATTTESDVDSTPKSDEDGDSGATRNTGTDGPPGPDDESAMAARLDPSVLASGLESLPATVTEHLSHPDPEPAESILPEWEVAGVEYFGIGARRDDWQLPLQDMAAFAGGESSLPAWPLASVCNRLAEGDAPTLVQLLVQPKPDWRAARDIRIGDLEYRQDRPRDKYIKPIFVELLGGTATISHARIRPELELGRTPTAGVASGRVTHRRPRNRGPDGALA